MFRTCIAEVQPLHEAIQDLEALNLWLKKGVIVRWAVVYPVKDMYLKVFFTMDEVMKNVYSGCKIIPLRRFERDEKELLQMIKVSKETITVP